MNISDAAKIAAAEDGVIQRRKRRESCPEHYIQLTNSSDGCIAMQIGSNGEMEDICRRWNPGDEDLLAEDWEVYRLEKDGPERVPYHKPPENLLAGGGLNIQEAVRQALAEDAYIARTAHAIKCKRYRIGLVKPFKGRACDDISADETGFSVTNGLWAPTVDDLMAEDWKVVHLDTSK